MTDLDLRYRVNAVLGAVAAITSAISLYLDASVRIAGPLWFSLGICVTCAFALRAQRRWESERRALQRELAAAVELCERTVYRQPQMT